MNALRIVLIGDHPGYLDALTTLVDVERGLSVVGRAGTDADVLRLVEETAPDLVLMDIRMPQMSGVELVRRMKRLASPPWVAVVSLHYHDDYRKRALDAGADAFFRKGVFTTEVLPWIQQLRRGGHR